MELKENIYVRTKYGINKIDRTFYTVSGVNHNYIELENCYIDDEYDLRQGISIEKIINASFNIIDLIEVGDYVNGKEVLDININHKELHINTENDILCFIKERDIKSIVTKEQFESMKYEVE